MTFDYGYIIRIVLLFVHLLKLMHTKKKVNEMSFFEHFI